MALVIWITWGVLAPLCAWLLWTGLRGDRARGRRRCRKCWHSMDGLPEREEGGWVCPECGKVAQAERVMLRPRRRRWRVGLGLLLLFSGTYGLIVYERREEGWSAWVPSTFVVLIYPREHGADEQPWRACASLIRTRLATERLGSLQYRILAWRMLDLTDEGVWDLIRVRDVWARGEPIAISVDWPDFSAGVLWESVMVKDLVWYDFGVGLSGCRFHQNRHTGGSLDVPGDALLDAAHGDWTTLTLNVEVKIGRGCDSPYEYTKVKHLSRTHTIRLIDREEAFNGGIITPVRDPAIDRWLLDKIHFTYGVATHGGRYVSTSSLEIYDDENPHDLCFAYDAEVYDENARLIYHATVPPWVRGTTYATPEEYAAFKARLAPTGAGRWRPQGLTLRIVPRPDLALRVLEQDRYWVPATETGFIEVPLAEHFRASRW